MNFLPRYVPDSLEFWNIRSIISMIKLGIKERLKLLNKKQLGNSKPFPVTNMPVYIMNSEQIGISE